MWVSTKKYGRVSKVLEKRNKIRYCNVALHIISYYTIKFDIILIAYYIDTNNTHSTEAYAADRSVRAYVSRKSTREENRGFWWAREEPCRWANRGRVVHSVGF